MGPISNSMIAKYAEICIEAFICCLLHRSQSYSLASTCMYTASEMYGMSAYFPLQMAAMSALVAKISKIRHGKRSAQRKSFENARDGPEDAVQHH